MSAIVSYEIRNLGERKLALISMDDGKVNSLSPDMLFALHESFDKAEAEEALVLLVGRKQRFCAGFDLKVFNKGKKALNDMTTAGARLAERMLAYPHPVIVACNGHALAMGAVLLLCADYRIGAEGDFQIGLNEVSLGMSFPQTAPTFTKTIFLHVFTPTWLKRAVMQSELFLPKDACEPGFLDEVVSEESLLERAREKAEQLAKLPENAFQRAKQNLRLEMLEELSQVITKK